MTACSFALALASGGLPSARADVKGELVETETLGMNVYSYDFTTSKAVTVGDSQNLSEFIGLHYYFIDHVRIGANLQFTERLNPSPPMGSSELQTFAILPQIGWNFYKPLFVQLTMTFAPWTAGKSNFDFGFQGVFGASFRLSTRVNGSVAIEIPLDLTPDTKLGLTPLVGISVRL